MSDADFNAGVLAAIAEYELCCELGIDYDAVAPRMRDLLRPAPPSAPSQGSPQSDRPA